LASAHAKIKAVCRHPVSITRLGNLGTGECLQSCGLALPGVFLLWKAIYSSRHRLVSFVQGAGRRDAQLLFDQCNFQGEFAILRNVRFVS